MADATFNDVIDRLKAEGHLTRNSGTNSLKSVKEELRKQTGIQETLLESFSLFFTRAESDRLQAKNRGLGTTKEDQPELVKKDTEESGMSGLLGGLGFLSALLGTAVAGGLASYGALNPKSFVKGLKGVFNGTVSAIAKMGTNIANLFKWFAEKSGLQTLVDKIKLKFSLGKMEFKSSNLGQAMTKIWDDLVVKFQVLKTKFIMVGEWFGKNVFDPIKKFLSFADEGADVAKAAKGESTLGKIVGKIGEFIKPFKDYAGRFIKFVGRILQPIAFIISAFDGIREAQKEMEKGELEGKDDVQQGIEAVTGFIGGFVGSFIGGFVDAIKGAIFWVVKKIFPGMVDEEGNFKTGSFMGDMLKAFDEFSFADKIIEGWNMIGDMISGMYTWVAEKIESIANAFGTTFLSTEQENKLAESKGGLDVAGQRTANRALKQMGINDASSLTDEQIAKFADENTGLMGSYSQSESELRMMLKRQRAADAAARKSEAERKQMELRRSQLAEENAKRSELEANAASTPVVISAPVTDSSTTNQVQNKTVNIPMSPGNSLNPDAYGMPF